MIFLRLSLFSYLCFTTFTLLFSAFTNAYSSSSSPSLEWDQFDSQVPRGQLFCHNFTSRILKNKRTIWIYTPACYEWKKGPYPLLIVFDGQAYTSQLIPGPIILDNLIAKSKIPPLVAVFISSLDQPTRDRELTCYSRFTACLIQELLPWVSRRYFISKDPCENIVAGSSYGGLAAAYAALQSPQRFGNVLSQSGSFWWYPSQTTSVPWLANQFESHGPLAVRFYLDVGDQETSSTKDRMSMIEANRHLRDILEKKGYQITYHEFRGGHEYDCWRKTFAVGLMALIGNKMPQAKSTLK